MEAIYILPMSGVLGSSDEKKFIMSPSSVSRQEIRHGRAGYANDMNDGWSHNEILSVLSYKHAPI